MSARRETTTKDRQRLDRDHDLTSGVETAYEVDYEKQNYSGNIYAYPVNAAGVVNRFVPAAPEIDTAGAPFFPLSETCFP